MALNRMHQVLNAATITASGNSGTGAAALRNLGLSENPTVVVYIAVEGTVSGTSPSLQLTVYGSPDGTIEGQMVQDTAITATATVHRIVIHDVFEPYLIFSWTITGTTPSFGGVTIVAYFSSPDN